MIEHDVNIYTFNDYVDYLDELYIYLKDKRADYSQRDYARDLNIPAPRINQILNRKEGLSAKRAIEIAKRIDLSQIEREYFFHLVSLKTSKSQKQREVSKNYIEKYNHDLGHNYLGVDSWSLLDLEGWDVVWNYIEVEPQLDKLRQICLKGGMLKSSFNEIILEFIEHELIGVIEGRVFKKKKHIAFGNSISSHSIRRYHENKLKESVSALKTLNMNSRKNESMTFSLKKSEVNIVNEKIERFLDDLQKGLCEKEHDDVMTINIALYPSLFKDRQ